MKYRPCVFLATSRTSSSSDTRIRIISFKDCLNHHLIFTLACHKGSRFNFHHPPSRTRSDFPALSHNVSLVNNLVFSFKVNQLKRTKHAEVYKPLDIQPSPKIELGGYATAQHPSDRLSTSPRQIIMISHSSLFRYSFRDIRIVVVVVHNQTPWFLLQRSSST